MSPERPFCIFSFAEKRGSFSLSFKKIHQKRLISLILKIQLPEQLLHILERISPAPIFFPPKSEPPTPLQRSRGSTKYHCNALVEALRPSLTNIAHIRKDLYDTRETDFTSRICTRSAWFSKPIQSRTDIN